MVAKFHAIKPHPINDVAMSKVLRDGSKSFGEICMENREMVTAGWTGDRPDWKIRYWANQYQIGFQVYTDEHDKGGQKWIWLDLGTKKNYPIPKNPASSKTLAFPSIYRAGSSPNQLHTGRKYSGGEIRFAKQVIHPGIKARNWSKLLAKKEEPLFAEKMQPWMEYAARASGHSMEK